MKHDVKVGAACSAMIAIFGVLGLACDSSRDSHTFDTAGSGVGSATSGADGGVGTGGDGAEGSSSGAVDGGGDGGPNPKLDVGGGADETGGSPNDSGDQCAEVSDTAMVGPQPADIIFVVDNSGSMDFEATAVQQNINMFSTQIFLANIDAHVALISSYPDNGAGICVGMPLGSGGCPTTDNNPPSFTHIDSSVDSHDALQQIIDHWADYSSVLRPTAARHVVVVSDDDSDMDAATFDSMFKALDGNNANYTFHAIASNEGPVEGCLLSTSCCIIAAAAGAVYKDLVMSTGGVWGNLCDQDFQPLFDALSTAVISGATLACEYDIPPPPDGQSFNKDQVNVEFDDGMGNALDIGRVDDASQCGGVMDGWYYDNPDDPTKILLCPQTCDELQGFTTASIAIKFGCATVPAG